MEVAHMEFLKSILENPFRVLGASPLDDRRRLVALGDEAALLGEENAEEAMNTLLNAQKRLEAEINWFPNTPAAQAEAVINYPNAEQPAPYPELGSECALAQFNACRVMLETWPVTDANNAFALCKSMINADSNIRIDQLLQEINRDREKAGFQPLADTSDLSYRLDALRHSAAQRIMDRIQEIPNIKLAPLMINVANLFKYTPSPLIEIMIGVYELKINDELQKLQADLIGQSNSILQVTMISIIKTTADSIRTNLEKWHSLTEPIRTLHFHKGIVSDDSRRIYHDVREAAVGIFNKHTQFDPCYNIIKSLSKVFEKVPDMSATLKKDLAQLDTIRMRAMMQQFNNR